MNLVFLGPPGAGKGTQSTAIVSEAGIPQISTGDAIRAAIGDDTELGRQAVSYTDEGLLVPDALINAMVKERLAQPDCANGFLLDGFPRTLAQAEALDTILFDANEALDHVLFLYVEDDLLLKRVTGRRSDPDTGKIYHLTYDPPPADIANRLVQRTDDTREVFERRLAIYRDKTAPLIPFYDAKGLLRRIDGAGTRAKIGERIRTCLKPRS